MSELDEWRRKARENAINDPDEVLAYMRRNTDPQSPTYRLELLYDEEAKTVLLQGNAEGLQNLLEAVARLIGSQVGAHTHFDRTTGLSKSNLELIIQRVADTDTGTQIAVDTESE